MKKTILLISGCVIEDKKGIELEIGSIFKKDELIEFLELLINDLKNNKNRELIVKSFLN